MAISLSYVPLALRTVLSRRQGEVGAGGSPPPLSWSGFKDAWFGLFWDVGGSNMLRRAAPDVAALLDGRTSGGRVLDAPAGPGIGGTVMEVGAGAGGWVAMYDDRGRDFSAGTTGRTPVTRVYGVEPNADHHANLRREVARRGLEGVYEIAPVGIEDLDGGRGGEKKWDGRVEKGSLDCIVSIVCMCSIPDPEANARAMYGYLKEGGRLYVLEHVRCEYSWYMRLYQRFVNIFWPLMIGGCSLCRPTEKTLREAGPWSRVDVGQPPAEQWFHCLPHVLGVFTK